MRQFIQSVKAKLRQSSVERELQRLSDRQLRDIGIDRSEIGAIVRFGKRSAV